jgi:hypothetical protein
MLRHESDLGVYVVSFISSSRDRCDLQNYQAVIFVYIFKINPCLTMDVLLGDIYTGGKLK